MGSVGGSRTNKGARASYQKLWFSRWGVSETDYGQASLCKQIIWLLPALFGKHCHVFTVKN